MSENVTICRCEEVTESEITEAIRSGARTITGVKRRTRAGMGLCQGRTCEELIRRLLAKETGQRVGKLIPCTRRPPFRPIKLGNLGRSK